jgi:hypothetical protein
VAGLPVLDRILDQVLGDPEKLVAVAEHKQRAVGKACLDRNAPLTAQRRERLDHVLHDGCEVFRLRWGDMGAHFDARQRQKVVDEPLHAVRLAPHDV